MSLHWGGRGLGHLGRKQVLSRPWTPAELSNLFAWFDASDSATVTQSSGAVSQWNDKSTNAFNVAQSVAGAKPQYSVTGLGGSYPGITFDGGDMLFMTSLSVAAGTLIQAFAVMRPTAITGSHDRVVSVTQGAANDSDSGGYIPILRNAGNNGWSGYSQGTGLLGVSGNLAANNTGIIGSHPTGTDHTAYLNGNAGTTVAVVYPSLFAPTKLGLGARAQDTAGNGSDSFTGVIAEVIMSTGTITTLNRQKVEGYLAWKYGLQASLPGGHPYASAAP